MPTIGYDSRAVLVGGRRTLVISGAVHYPRSEPSMWPSILRRSREAGLNCIETYVFWEGHQPQEGVYDFSGRFDLARFLDACAAEGLYAILRIGPYICAEWNFGGLPWWLLTKPGMVTRTWNEPFMRAVARWLEVLMAEVGDRQATRGGPVILAQLENEYNNVASRYGQDGARYLRWIGEAGREAGLEVPLVMCEGAGDRAVETLNGFSVEGRMAELRRHRPDQPLLWTENWPGWYDTWGFSHHTRRAAEIAYRVTRFFGAGGTGVNYYMWHGGTNFARDAMYLQATSYDFDAPIDEYGLETSKSRHLGRLHAALHECEGVLLHGEGPAVETVEPPSAPGRCDDLVSYRWTAGDGTAAFVCNGTGREGTCEALGATLALPPLGAAIVLRRSTDAPRVLFRTRDEQDAVRRTMAAAPVELTWLSLPEPMPDDVAPAARRTVEVPGPVDMLPLTRDETDYAWYLAEVASPSARKARLECAYVADVMSVWVNGRHQGSAPERLVEDRRDAKLFRQSLEVALDAGPNRLAILVASLGLIKGDWMIDAPQSREKKGLCGAVTVDGVPVAGPWRIEIGLWGERVRLFEAACGAQAAWRRAPGEPGRPVWHRAEFALPPAQLADEAPWALDATGLGKGMLWVNGRCIGRHWQIPSVNIWRPRHEHEFVGETGEGQPTQRYYHVPREYLRGQNAIVVFDEQGSSPGRVKLCRRR